MTYFCSSVNLRAKNRPLFLIESEYFYSKKKWCNFQISLKYKKEMNKENLNRKWLTKSSRDSMILPMFKQVRAFKVKGGI